MAKQTEAPDFFFVVWLDAGVLSSTVDGECGDAEYGNVECDGKPVLACASHRPRPMRYVNFCNPAPKLSGGEEVLAVFEVQGSCCVANDFVCQRLCLEMEKEIDDKRSCQAEGFRWVILSSRKRRLSSSMAR